MYLTTLTHNIYEIVERWRLQATKATEIANLQSKIAELKGTPAEPKQEITVKKEPTAEEENIEDFASKHEDDTLAIMQKAKEVGFF